MEGEEAKRCPACGRPLKPLPVRLGYLPHFLCRECNVVLASSGDEMWVCELAERHVPFAVRV